MNKNVKNLKTKLEQKEKGKKDKTNAAWLGISLMFVYYNDVLCIYNPVAVPGLWSHYI